MRTLVLLFLAAGAAATGCSSTDSPLAAPDVGGPPPGPVLTLEPRVVRLSSLPLGRADVRIEAAVNGVSLPPNDVYWISDDPDVVGVSEGRVSRRGPGSAAVRAVVGSLVDTVPAEVSADSEFVEIAHRGYARVFPENTLPAFVGALAAGAHAIELDVWQSADSQLIVIHDPTVDRTTNGTGRVADLTLTQLRRLDACRGWAAYSPCAVPTLAEALEAVPSARVFIELKGRWQSEGVHRVLETVEAAGMRDLAVVISFSKEALRLVREADARMQVGFITTRMTPPDSLAPLAPVSALVWNDVLAADPPGARAWVRELRGRGMDVAAWTFIEERRARLVRGIAPVRIITDVPLPNMR